MRPIPSPSCSIYTSGASESNNLAVKGIAWASRHIGRHILSTPLEHPSVTEALAALREQGYEVEFVSIGRDGTINLEQLRALELALTRQRWRVDYVRALNSRLRAALTRYPLVRINSPDEAVPHILNLSVQGVKGTAFRRALSCGPTSCSMQ